MPKIKRFSGINNVVREEYADIGFLTTAENVYATGTGAIVSRSGLTVRDATALHSPFGFGAYVYYVAPGSQSGHSIWRTNFTEIPEEVVTSLADSSSEMSYLQLNGLLYYSNGTDKGIIAAAVGSSWGVDAPAAITTSDSSGTLESGSYLVSVAFVLSDGQESAACVTDKVTVTNGGILVDPLPTSADPRVTHVAVYVSKPNGRALETGGGLYLRAEVANGTASYTVDGSETLGRRCVTLNHSSMPAVKHPTFYRGVVYGSYGEVIFHSAEGMYELTRPDRSFLPFEDTVTAIAAVDNGLWVGTSRHIMFLSGKNPFQDGGFQIVNKIVAPCLSGGVVVDASLFGRRGMEPGNTALMLTSVGILAGSGNGALTSITGGHWRPGTTTAQATGTVLYIGDMVLYVFPVGSNLYAMNIETGAVTKMVVGATSASSYNYGLNMGVIDPNGLHNYSGTTDNGADIDASFSRTGLSFDSNMEKRITDAYLHMKCNGTYTFSVTANQVTGSVNFTDALDYFHGSKVDLPRGIHGRNLGYTMENVDGAPFEVEEVDLNVEVYKRRSRQNA